MDWLNPWLIGTLALLLGMALGAGVLALVSRRASGGKSLNALREEFDEYRDDVNEHFDRTSELFREMTEKYRDVYNHLAAGAQSLGKDLEEAPRLEIIERSELPPAGQDDEGGDDELDSVSAGER